MSKFAWTLIAIMLVHGLFTCALAAGHIEDGQHTFDYTYHDNHVHDNSPQSEPDSEHEHQFHAHISCITGYSSDTADDSSPELSIAFRHLSFNSKHPQPPVPPPDY